MGTPPGRCACCWAACSPRGQRRVIACCDPRDAASLERLGMRREGHLRQSAWAEGEWTDELVYGLLPDEWQSG